MALILPVNGIHPKLGEGTWLAPNATVVGDVVIGKECSVWFNAVIRGDVHSIRIGDNCNIQDGAVLHCTYQKAALSIGNNVSIAHNAIVHGCALGNDILVGMGAIVMDHAVVEDRVIIAAGAIVTQNTRLESGWIYAGAPAKKLKPLSEEAAEVFARTANNYKLYKTWFPA